MKTNITKEDVLELYEELLQYAETVSAGEIEKMGVALFAVESTIHLFDKLTVKELNNVFKVVYKAIGKDFSEYK